jgi:hypothetical protein
MYSTPAATKFDPIAILEPSRMKYAEFAGH